jgi:hypothetical protein
MRSLPTALFEESVLNDCHVKLLQGLRTHFEDLPQLKAVASKRKAFEEHIKTLLKKPNLFDGFAGRVSSDVRAGDSGVPGQAIFKVDAQIECNRLCGGRHSMNIELCIQNREAIGTNFLKLETLANLESSSDHLGVLICPDAKYFASSNMDSSYADDDEYIVAFKLAYHRILKSKMIVLTVGD